jgi:hypothetical protein
MTAPQKKVEEVSVEPGATNDTNDEARPVSIFCHIDEDTRCDFHWLLRCQRLKAEQRIELATRQDFVEAVFNVLFWNSPSMTVAKRWQSVLEFMYSRRKLLEDGDGEGRVSGEGEGGVKQGLTIAACHCHSRRLWRKCAVQCSACGNTTTAGELRALVADMDAACGFLCTATVDSELWGGDSSRDDALAARTTAFHELLGGASRVSGRGGNLCWPCLQRFHSCHVCAGSTNSLESVHACMVAAGLNVRAYHFEEIPFGELGVRHQLPGGITKSTQVCHTCFATMRDDLNAHRPPTPNSGTPT